MLSAIVRRVVLYFCAIPTVLVLATSHTQAQSQSIAVTQQIKPDGYSASGDRLTYTVKLTNIGSSPLSNVTVQSSLQPEPVCLIGLLSPTYTATCTGVYFVQSSDLSNRAPGENRVFVFHGLRTLQDSRRPGLRALVEANIFHGAAGDGA